MEHVKILLQIFTLLIGAVVIFDIYHIYKTFRYPFLRPLIGGLIFLNLGILSDFLSHYLSLNFFQSLLGYKHSGMADILGPLGLLFYGVMVYFIFRFSWTAREKTMEKWIQWSIGVLMGLLIINWLSTLASYAPVQLLRGAVLGEMVMVVLFFFSYGALIHFTWISFQLKDKNRKKTFTLFGLFYSAAYITFALTIFSPEPWIRITDILVLVFVNGFPMFWVRRYVLKYYHNLPSIIADADFHNIFKKYGISERQQEIIRLILHGKSNREIAEQLFIAPHTVKNHIYNLYQKLSVKSRYELVHFFVAYVQK